MVGLVMTASSSLLQPLGHQAAGLQRDIPIIHLDDPAVGLLEQIADAGRDQVDHAQFQRFLTGDAVGFPYRALGPVGVAATLFGEAANIGHGIVDGLLHHRVPGRGDRSLVLFFLAFPFFPVRAVVLLLALPFRRVLVLARCGADDRDRRSRTDVGGRAHGRNVARIQNVGACAGCPRAGGPDPGGHRHRRIEDVLDDVAGRSIQPAGGIHADNHQRCFALRRRFQRARHEVSRGRADRALDVKDQGQAFHRAVGSITRLLREGLARPQHHQHQEQQDARRLPDSVRTACVHASLPLLRSYSYCY
jgi:hypothetical protein